MSSAREFEDAPPGALEDCELRGPMDGYPRLADFRQRPLAQRLLDGLEARGDEVIHMYPSDGVDWTARRVRERALQLAAGMQTLGVKPADVVALACAHHPEYAPLFLATLLVGAAWAPISSDYDDGDLRLLLAILEPRVVLAKREVADRLRPLLALLQSQSTLAVLCEGKEWEALATTASPESWPPLPPPPRDPRAAVALVASSSGTTGLPKACATSYFALFVWLSVLTRPDSLDGLKEYLVLTSPGSWVSCIWLTLLTMLGSTRLVYIHGCDEHQFLEAIEKHRAPVIFTSNNFLLSAAKVHETSKTRRDLSSLRCMLTGGAAISRASEEFVVSVMGTEVFNIYGMTEVCASHGIMKRSQYKPGSVGTLSAFLRCRVQDPDFRRLCGPHEEGELTFKGAMLFQGYLKNPEASAALFDAQGWLHSGDLGRYDEDGFFYILGSIKDALNCQGVHVSPVPIEGVLESHPAVLESAVVGVPDPVEQELPRAYVVLRPNAQATEEELCQFVEERVAPHKWLRGGVVFLEELPKTSTGKISRAAIRKQFVLQQSASAEPGSGPGPGPLVQSARSSSGAGRASSNSLPRGDGESGCADECFVQ